jgi:prepilin peptidase CpaA
MTIELSPDLYFLLPFVALAAIIDMKVRRIPNLLVLAGLLISLTYHSTMPVGSGMLHWLFGAGAGFLIFMPLYLVKGIAAGDVKLMAAVGAFVGPMLILKVALAACIFGGIGALAIVVFGKNVRTVLRNIHIILLSHGRLSEYQKSEKLLGDAISFPSVGRMPYGAAIALGTMYAVLTS